MIEPRLRAVLLGIAAAGFAGMIAELLLVEHWGLPWQITPFTLSAVAIVSIFLFALRPCPDRRPVALGDGGGGRRRGARHVPARGRQRGLRAGDPRRGVDRCSAVGCPARRGSGHGARRSCHGGSGSGCGDLETARAPRLTLSGRPEIVAGLTVAAGGTTPAPGGCTGSTCAVTSAASSPSCMTAASGTARPGDGRAVPLGAPRILYVARYILDAAIKNGLDSREP